MLSRFRHSIPPARFFRLRPICHPSVTRALFSTLRTKASVNVTSNIIAGAIGLSVFGFGSFALSAPQSSARATKAEALYNDSSYSREKLLEFLKQCNLDDPNNPEIMWRLARAAYDLSGLESTPKDKKKELTYYAFDIIKKTLEIGENNFAVHKWYGIILSSIGDFEGTKVTIANSYAVKEHWEKAVALNPKDATSRHLLGRWCFNIANISWVERKVASAIFGSPPQATYQEALDHFQASEAISPGYWKKNSLMIAQCYLKLKDSAKAKEWLEKTLKSAVKTEEDIQVQKEAELLLSKL